MSIQNQLFSTIDTTQEVSISFDGLRTDGVQVTFRH